MSFLISLDGPSPGKRFPIGSSVFLGGPEPASVPAPGVEPVQIRHADRRYVATAPRPFLVNDAETTEHKLRSGDVIAVGSSRFLFRSEDTSTIDRRAPHLGALYRVAAILTGGEDLRVSLGNALAVLLEETAASRAAAWLADEDGGKIERVAAVSRPAGGEALLEAAFPSVAALQNAVAASKSTLVLPLVARSQALGALVLEGPPVGLPARDVELLTAVSLIASVSAENRRNARQMEEYGRLLMSIEKATMWLSGYLEREPILGEAVGFARSIFKASHVSIAEIEADGKSARIVRAVNPRKTDPTSYLIKVGEGMCGRVLQTGKSLLSPDPATGKAPEGYARSKRFKTDSFAIVPIFASAAEGGGDLVGAINVADKIGGRPFNERDLELLAVLARAVGVALHNAQLYERATVDSLTRLFVRQHFFYKLEEHLAAATKSRRPLSVAIADLDDFKKVNDTHGHPAGDAVLRAAGAAVKRAVRPGDIAARYGGEEFGLIFPGATLAEARVACNAVLEALRAAEVDTGGGKIRMTASMGLAELRSGDTPESLIARADAAQYRAKYGGKNRLVEADK